MPVPSPYLTEESPSQKLNNTANAIAQMQTQAQEAYPALYLYPLNNSFVPKHITLTHGQRVKIGRQTNAKTSPAERNGYFDSKVLSRQHAEVWEEGGKIYIKDVKSSNGTFINGERLSAESVESEPFELKSDDIVEFGIDIVGEDNKTIIHHKVAARVVCVFNEQDVQVAARAEQHQAAAAAASGSSPQPGSSGAQQPSGPGSAFNFQAQPGQTQRRGPVPQQGLGVMGGMGGSMRPPGKSGLTFDHILSRLQGELQKSRETGAELHSLTGAMTDIHDTLGGSLPSNLPPYPQSLPPVRPPSQQPSQSHPQNTEPSTSSSPPQPSPSLSDLQSQLSTTQSSLESHINKMRALDTMLAEHDALKRELASLREAVDATKGHHARESDPESDDDDAASIATLGPHTLSRVDEEDEERVRPRTPEPYEDEDRDRGHDAQHKAVSPSVVDELTERLSTLSKQLASALEMSSALQAQQRAAQGTISALESKVATLETLINNSTPASAPSAADLESEKEKQREAERAKEQERESELARWKRSVEGQWATVQEEWTAERQRLAAARDEWEAKARVVETLAAVQQLSRTNGNAKHGSGLVTPPSPRSLSADSGRRQRRKRRSRSRSRSHSPGGTDTTAVEELAEPISPRPYSPEDREGDGEGKKKQGGYLATPESSIHREHGVLASLAKASEIGSGSVSKRERVEERTKGVTIPLDANISTAVGVIVLGVAAAAVLWRVKPE